MSFSIITLSNGTTVIMDHRPHAADFAFGLAYAVGSRDEAPDEHGLDHCIEHMVARGSEKYPTAFSLARPLDRLGASPNAFTDTELTLYHTQVTADGWRTAVDLTADTLLHPLFRPGDLKQEKGAILEEAIGDLDNPMSILGETLQRMLYGKCSLGRNIIGTRQAIRSITVEGMRAFMARTYVPRATAVIAVGNIDAGFLPEVERLFGGLPDRPAEHLYDALGQMAKKRHCAVHLPELNQMQAGLVFPNHYGFDHPDRPVAKVISVVLGEIMSSILLEEVRNKRGMVYEIGSDAVVYRGTGNFDISFAMAPPKFAKALAVVVDELRKIKECGLSEDDLDTAKCAINNSLIIGSQDSEDEVTRLAFVFASGQDTYRLGDVTRRYETVTNERVIAVANEMFRASNALLATVGPVTDLAPYLAVIERLGG